MITAVDTQVLLDVLLADPTFADISASALDKAAREGNLIICEAVLAELATRFPDEQALEEFMVDMNMDIVASSQRTWWIAGQAWKSYNAWRKGVQRVQCPACGSDRVGPWPDGHRPVAGRQHGLADFLIGAPASTQADRLLTRDSGYYHRWFTNLALIDPTQT